MSYPQLWQVFGIHRWNLDANGASHNGHLILPLAKAYTTRSHGMATTASTKASAVQTKTRSENNHGNIQRNTRTARAIVSNGAKALATSR